MKHTIKLVQDGQQIQIEFVATYLKINWSSYEFLFHDQSEDSCHYEMLTCLKKELKHPTQEV